MQATGNYWSVLTVMHRRGHRAPARALPALVRCAANQGAGHDHQRHLRAAARVSEAETAAEDEADDTTAAAANATGDARRQAAAGVAVFMDKSASADGLNALPSSTDDGYLAAPAAPRAAQVGPTCNYPDCTFGSALRGRPCACGAPHHQACYDPTSSTARWTATPPFGLPGPRTTPPPLPPFAGPAPRPLGD